MSETTTTDPTVVKPTEPAQAVTPDPAIPYARFKEVNDRMKSLEAEIAKREDAERKARDKKALEEKDKDVQIESLTAKLSEHEARLKSFDEMDKKEREMLIALIKDDSDKAIAAELSTTNLRLFVEKLEGGKIGPSAQKGKVPAADEVNPFKAAAGESFEAWQRRVQGLKRQK
jgi:hypothetical protein